METLEWIFKYFIVPMIGGFIGAIIVKVLKNKMEDQIMTVQELIDALNKVEDKTLDVLHYDCSDVEEVDISESEVILY